MSQNCSDFQIKDQDLREIFENHPDPMAVIEGNTFSYYNNSFSKFLELDGINKVSSYESLFNEPLPVFQDKEFSKRINYRYSENEFSILDIRLYRMESASLLLTLRPIDEPSYSIPSFGEFVGILAHQLSNPIAILQVNCDSFYLEAKNDLKQPIEEVLERCERMREALEKYRTYIVQLKELTLAFKEHPENFVGKNLTSYWKESTDRL